MLIPVWLPWVGGGLAATAVGLRIRKVFFLNKPAAATPQTAVPRTQPQATPAQVAAAAASAGVPPAVLAEAAANAGTTPAAIVGAAMAAGSDVADAILQAANQQTPELQAQINPDTVIQLAQVTTNDQPPSGDLRIFDLPSTTSIQVGGAEKNGIVTVIDPNVDGTFAQISWPGGNRLPPASGFAKKAFLKLL